MIKVLKGAAIVGSVALAFTIGVVAIFVLNVVIGAFVPPCDEHPHDCTCLLCDVERSRAEGECRGLAYDFVEEDDGGDWEVR